MDKMPQLKDREIFRQDNIEEEIVEWLEDLIYYISEKFCVSYEHVIVLIKKHLL